MATIVCLAMVQGSVQRTRPVTNREFFFRDHGCHQCLLAHRMVSLLQSGVSSTPHGLDENVERHL